MRRRPFSTRRSATIAAALALALSLAGAATHLALAQQDPGSLRNRIQQQKGQERQLASAAARLGRLEQATSRAVAVLESRLAAAQADLARWQARLAATQRDLRATRRRLVRLRARLAQSRDALATMLRQRYTADQPDIVSVVLEARGFADVLERLEFLKRVQRSDTLIVEAVRRGRDDARRDELRLAALEPRQRLLPVVVGRGQRRGPDAERLGRADLIVHQRDQRRDDQRRPLACQRRHLVAQRLARAGRHHRERV
ncbi:MAG: hypothetical protein V7607_1250, partial [Solirubrobacteraceae bacterium]